MPHTTTADRSPVTMIPPEKFRPAPKMRLRSSPMTYVTSLPVSGTTGEKPTCAT